MSVKEKRWRSLKPSRRDRETVLFCAGLKSQNSESQLKVIESDVYFLVVEFHDVIAVPSLDRWPLSSDLTSPVDLIKQRTQFRALRRFGADAALVSSIAFFDAGVRILHQQRSYTVTQRGRLRETVRKRRTLPSTFLLWGHETGTSAMPAGDQKTCS